ncbi:hypothetical protein BKA70DRAFT_1418152 [Coprinopsis sp. MPI-PUGE-AT-0042]|nr:hypothetical protein BKA70DRAFT_1418152 [Coprinopsis sp. MPI-PUGE-AT-0042]
MSVPKIRGQAQAVVIFALTLFAFVAESQLTQYVQTNLGFRQPFFIFYFVHSAFSFIFPLHLLYLKWTTGYSAFQITQGVLIAITKQLSPKSSAAPATLPKYKLARLLILLTVGITCPGLLWFAAISLASVSDVTAIWNTNAFFAYLISVKLFHLKWEPRKLFAVLLATIGTLIVVYGGVDASTPSEPDAPTAEFLGKPKAPLIGNLLTLIASFGYGLYQVLYKIYAALPSDPEVAHDRSLYEQVLSDEERDPLDADPNGSFAGNEPDTHDALYPPPFGLHPNFLTSVIGCITCLVLWIPIPFLHWSGIEIFVLPSNWITLFSMMGIALGGMVFNAGFMILLGVWGPIVTSVGNLLTIVLMLISDAIFGLGLEAITRWSLIGSSVIVFAFGVLVYDMVLQSKL